jgi:hypothetical protein
MKSQLCTCTLGVWHVATSGTTECRAHRHAAGRKGKHSRNFLRQCFDANDGLGADVVRFTRNSAKKYCPEPGSRVRSIKIGTLGTSVAFYPNGPPPLAHHG